MLLVQKGILDNSVIESLVDWVREGSKRDSGNGAYHSLKFITWAAALAHYGLLESLDCIRLGDVDLRSVPAQHLVSLVSRVKWCVTIRNVRGCDLVALLDSLRCHKLNINNSLLKSKKTKEALMGRLLNGPTKFSINTESWSYS